ncbi:c-type cytochrome [Meridianimarinicoccus sp. RP-17]|uniref:c-type cytochrome n=1 Tax=Meridianimarinicoccus zhengii TaxID=2056810 RepID=UPI000DAB4091|nr:c-type cytochrome [Phycocomes zhengii]
MTFLPTTHRRRIAGRATRSVRTLCAAFLIVVASGPALAQSADDGLAGGDADRGAELFQECSGCHEVGPDARNRIGPHLNRVFDRRAGSIDGFAYSKGMDRMGADGLTWGYETLDAYIANPRALVSRTRMSYRGMEDPADRRDLMAFLRAYSAAPSDIPESPPTASDAGHDLDPAILALEGDPAYGEYLSGECITCHSAQGADSGIPSITQWPEEDFVVALHAYKQKLRPHQAMQMIAGRLNDEEIAALAAYFATLAPR